MGPIAILVFLGIGAIAGWLAGNIMSGGGFGLFGNIIVGVLGAVVAGFLLPSIIPVSGILGQIISATIGAVILLFVIKLIKR